MVGNRPKIRSIFGPNEGQEKTNRGGKGGGYPPRSKSQMKARTSLSGIVLNQCWAGVKGSSLCSSKVPSEDQCTSKRNVLAGGCKTKLPGSIVHSSRKNEPEMLLHMH